MNKQKQYRIIKRVIINALLTDPKSYSYFEKLLRSLPEGFTKRADHWLAKFVQEGVIERVSGQRGVYSLTLKTRVELNKREALAPIAIIGGGEGRNLALRSFGKAGITPKYFLLSVKDFLPLKIFQISENLLKELSLKDYKVFVDFTG